MFGVVKSYTESDDFHFLEIPCELEEGESISQNDLLLISNEKVLMVFGLCMFFYHAFCTLVFWIVWLFHQLKLTFFSSFYWTMINTWKYVDDHNTHAFALVENVRRFPEARLLRVRLYLAGEFPRYNTNSKKASSRLKQMQSYICETERQLHFLKVTCCILYCILLEEWSIVFVLSQDL